MLLSFPMSLQVNKSRSAFNPIISEILVSAVPSFFYQLGFAGITEEPLFRGFLWGYLRKAGWRERWIWICQIVLFTLGHVYYLHTAPISFWIVVPVNAAVLGVLAWRSRSIATTMACHAADNALGYSFALLLANLRS